MLLCLMQESIQNTQKAISGIGFIVADELKELDYNNVVNLDGGLDNCQKAHEPLKKVRTKVQTKV